MYRALCFVIVLLLAISPVEAGETKKLTNAELKEMTSRALFYAGYSLEFGRYFLVTLFRGGTRQVLWTNGARGWTDKGKWWIDGDRMCWRDEEYFAKWCSEWRTNGDRIETWRGNDKVGYIYILD